MAKQTVNIGVTANDNTGDPLRTAFDKANDNFDEIYLAGPVSSNVKISTNVIASTNTNGNINITPTGTGQVVITSVPTNISGNLKLGDGSTQNTGIETIYHYIIADRSTISSTATDAFGKSATLAAARSYDFNINCIATNSSTGNISVELTDASADIAECFALVTSHSPTAGRKEVSLQTATTVDTKVNTAETTHINVTGTLRTVTGGNLTIKLKTASGTVTPKAGSSFEFHGKIDNDIGNTV